MTGQNKLKLNKNMLDDNEESKINKKTDDKPNDATLNVTKAASKMPTSKRKTFSSKVLKPEEDAKKPDIYEAMKGAGFGVPKPKIVTNNVRAYKY